MRAAFFGLALTILALGLAATATGGPSTPSAIPGCAKGDLSLLKEGTLTIGGDNPSFPPFYGGAPKKPWKISNPYSGKGYESAVAYAVAKQLGFSKRDVVWTPLVWTASFRPGKKPFDIYLAQISYLPERAKNVDFSNSYLFLNQSVVANAGTPIANVKTVDGLRPYKLGVTIGTTAYDYVTRWVRPSQKPNVYDSQTDAVSALNSKQIDGIVVDFPSALYVTAVQLDDGVIVGKLPTRGPREHFGIVLQKGSPNLRCVNKAVNRLWANGTIKKLQKAWIAKTAPDLRWR
ncbi:MAG: ABC transporter substrate-binding protein [Thermoleophilia bacterium]|nr:ABC transporter substrate-binding protein [Thermoleophilia bacterium]MDH4340836.1 ABC transporter substrate-binding protein [Thermoleophilia bacterium]MDH5281597.1 ABC transporter substrate-binding protein [Thermoleophilia bacterium]